jgi:hypothetical protein
MLGIPNTRFIHGIGFFGPQGPKNPILGIKSGPFGQKNYLPDGIKTDRSGLLVNASAWAICHLFSKK